MESGFRVSGFGFVVSQLGCEFCDWVVEFPGNVPEFGRHGFELIGVGSGTCPYELAGILSELRSWASEFRHWVSEFMCRGLGFRSPVWEFHF